MSTAAANASSSRIPSTTPLRAITSTISSRSTPSIPPASQAYEPLVKALFRHRLRFTLLRSAGWSWIIHSIWSWWQVRGTEELGFLGALTLPFTPRILFLAFLSWTLVALPISVLRKVFLTAQRSGGVSPIATVKRALAQNSTKIAFITYAVSAISALIIHILMTNKYEIDARGDPKITLFVRSKKHPHYLNGRLLFLIATQFAVALAFSLRGAMIDRFVYRWILTLNRNQTPLILTVLVSLFVASAFTTLAVVVAAFVCALARFSLPILYKIPFLSLLLRPFTAHFLKGPWTITLPIRHQPLLSRAWFLAFGTFLNWEIADCLFDNVVVDTTPIAVVSADPNTTLISGLTSSDRIFKFFAYSELRELAIDKSTSASARRTALFGDQKSALNLWALLSRESLLLLGHDYQTFLRRGQPPPAPAAPTPAQPKVVPAPQIATPVPLLRQRVFKTPEESPGLAALDALASNGPIAKVVDVGADATHVPELFRSVETRVMSSPIAEEAKKNVKNVKGLGSRLRGDITAFTSTVATKYVPERLREKVSQFLHWCNKERTSRIVEASLPFWELDVVVVDVLSHLTCASLTEDRYGVVQRDIPKILEAMISYLSAIEQYQIEINALNKPSSTPLSLREQHEKDALLVEIHKAQEILGHMADGLKEGIARIVRTFGDKLLAFKFPPRIANKLQAFLDYS
ncbi:nucleoporin protein Ndc1-Nup [Flammula alnicola]|nr:nucleoporin protein Ndc1-Nup [Flammula alnicola]